jgi:hypothetical protein
MIRRRPAVALLALAVVGCQKPSPRARDAAHEEPAAAAPPALRPFEIEYRSISRFPTCLSNTRTRIDREGKVYTATNRTECAPGEAWSAPYPATPVRVLSAAQLDDLAGRVRDSGLLDLPADNRDPKRAPTDGRVQEIELVLGTRAHKVVIHDVAPAAFDKVHRLLVDAGGEP